MDYFGTFILKTNKQNDTPLLEVWHIPYVSCRNKVTAQSHESRKALFDFSIQFEGLQAVKEGMAVGVGSSWSVAKKQADQLASLLFPLWSPALELGLFPFRVGPLS